VCSETGGGWKGTCRKNVRVLCIFKPLGTAACEERQLQSGLGGLLAEQAAVLERRYLQMSSSSIFAQVLRPRCQQMLEPAMFGILQRPNLA
jgi:hypothetical protein